MAQKRVGLIDYDTGEMLNGIPVWVGRKSAFTQMYGKGGFLVMAQEALLRLAMDKELTQEPMRVFVYLCARLDFENYIRVPQVEICEALSMKKPNVSRAVKLLENKGIILKGPKVGQSYAYRLNPNYGYKGDPRKVIQGNFGAQKKQGFEVINGGKAEPSAAEISEMRKLEEAGQQRLFE